MLSFDFLTPFYNQCHTRDTLLEDIEGVVAAHELNVRALPFYSSTSPAALLEEAAQSTEWRIHALHEEEGLMLFNGVCSSSNGSQHPQEHQREGRFFVWVHSEYPKIYVLLTLESSWFFQRLVALIEKSYPQAVTTFITHRRLRRLLEAFVEQNSFSRLVIRRASLRVRFDEDHPAEDERVMKMVSWPNMELGEAFDWVYQHNGWFQSLQFDACQDHRVLASVSFTRQGILRSNSLVSQAFASFVEPVCKTIDENVRFFGQRGRRSRGDLSVRPLVVDFQVDQV
ncbi:MAG: hypothetical protein HY318_06100, partial [Armatimonadetes bacterium]|nr:hypothetical protein [Armatimonadota bacterium]